jgi:glucosamine--fructose-6-phosphate aminotransferase (isomerizing)
VSAIVNVETSTIAREADVVLPTLAGPEIGVASTKAFTCQLSVLACLALAVGKARGVVTIEQERELVRALVEVPRHMASVLASEPRYEALAHTLSAARDVLYIGRGISYPLALEGALKLKEISYIHAEGYAAGELKHGPIALISEAVPVVVVAPHDRLFEKTVSNMQEAAARGGRIILISNAPPAAVGCQVEAHIPMPDVHQFVAPLVYALPLQVLAYHAAVRLGTDVDQPRNLAKSVTVE